MATHSSTVAWKIPWTEVPDRLVSGIAKSHTRLSNFTPSSCPALPANSLPSEPPGKPYNNTMGEKSQSGFELITFKSGGTKGENHPEGVNGLTNTFFF
jgi:hypothetical protein